MTDAVPAENARCCSTSREREGEAMPAEVNSQTSSARPIHREAALPGGTFLMGDHFGEGYAPDGEALVHGVSFGPFAMDTTCVTIAQFSAFARATGYRTEAERYGNSSVLRLAVTADRPDIFGYHGTPRWLTVRGADWQHPFAPRSGIEDLMDHPVVHVSHADALAYCEWAGLLKLQSWLPDRFPPIFIAHKDRTYRFESDHDHVRHPQSQVPACLWCRLE
jgi:formylglycine-generating enzyme